jgi:hypothetical protein
LLNRSVTVGRCLLVCGIIIGLLGSSPVAAQQDEAAWSSPELIAQTTGNLSVSSMALVADRAGNLHLFFPHQPDETFSAGIDYLYWDGADWSQPVSVLVNEDGSDAAHPRAAIDSRQVVHLIWYGGNNGLRYASAPVTAAASPHAWSRPEIVARALPEADIVASPDDLLYVAYADAMAMESIFLIRSPDGGETWFTPLRVASSDRAEIALNQVRLAADGGGRLHVTWTEYQLPDGWPPTGAFYARSVAGGQSWELPLRVADEDHGHIGLAAVGDRVHLVWRSRIGGDGTFHQWSADAGATWSTPDKFEDRGGFSGLPSFAADSAGALHYVIGAGFVATWQDGALGPYVDVASEELRTGLNQGEGWTNPERAVMAITTGNRLHVVFETGAQKLWHTTRLVEAPAVPGEALPTPVATPTSVPQEPGETAQPEPAPTATRAVLLGPFSSTRSEPLPAVVFGVAGSAALVLVVVVWQITRRRG